MRWWWRGRGAGVAGGHTGDEGERIAERYLRRRGYRRLRRNWRNAFGEIDLVMRGPRPAAATGPGGRAVRGPRPLVIVEVKAGVRHPRYRPEDHVTADKRRRLRRLAGQLRRRYGLQHELVRFDVVAVVFDPAGVDPPEVRHHAGAFGG